MNRTLLVGLLGAWLLGGSVYSLDAREIAVVTLFGKPVKTVTEPGLQVRLPWPVHQVIRFDRRAQLLSVEPAEVLTKDKKNLVVEAFLLWRITDPERFLEAVGNQDGAKTQLSDLVVSRIAAGLGNREFSDLMTTDGQAVTMLPDDLLPGVVATVKERLGIDVLDVRLRHVGLPLQNEQSIYERMRAERSRIANAYRSEGEERASTIRAEADRKAAEIMANAQKESMAIRARAEGTAAKIYAEAYEEDPDFYLFMRRLESAETLLDEGSVLVVDSNGPLFQGLTGGVK
ncbi:MAG: protease modulator HflC [Deltaproteobacteria bacterium]|nr:protease modulator HflC [Deltaproteobacteria bacterium]